VGTVALDVVLIVRPGVRVAVARYVFIVRPGVCVAVALYVFRVDDLVLLAHGVPSLQISVPYGQLSLASRNIPSAVSHIADMAAVTLPTHRARRTGSAPLPA
jgi:hypothetical protein